MLNFTFEPGVYDFQNNGGEIQCKLKLDISAAKISAMSSVTGKMSFLYKVGIKIKKYYLLKYGLLNLGPFFIISLDDS